MNWNNLKKNNCPKCGRFLESFTDKMINCKNCSFSISITKHKILLDKLSRSPRDWEKTNINEEALNNF